MADQNLTSNITVGIVVDDKQVAKELDKVARMFGTTGAELTKKLNVDFIKSDDIDQLAEAQTILWSMVNSTDGLKKNLKGIFDADPAALDRYIVKLREILVLQERGGPKQRGGSARAKTGKVKDMEDAISKELFGEKGVKFNVGSFKGKLETRIKTWSEDFGDDAIDSIDLAAAGLEDVTNELNDYARNIANAVGVKFKNVDETAMDFLEASDPKDAETMVGALQKLKDGMKLSTKELLSVQNFNLNDDGKFTVSPAMFIDAYEKAVIKYGEDLFVNTPVKTKGGEKAIADLQTKLEKLTKEYDAMLAAMGTPFFKKDLFKKLEEEIKTTQDKISNALLPKGIKDFEKLDKFPEQASDNVISFLEKELANITKTPKGQSKLDKKIEEITFKIIQDILEKARAAGARTLKNPKDFNRRMLNDYAPAADIKDIAGSEDTENLFRYAQEKAAKKAHELELKFGLAEGTVAAYANVFSLIAEVDNDSLFSLADAAQAIMSSSFTDISGANIPSANARGLGRVNATNGGLKLRFPEQMGLDIQSQILANPAILENLISTKPDALDKKVQALLVQRAKELGRELLPEETIEAIQLALVQSFVGQVRYAKVDEQDIVAEQVKLSKKITGIYYAGKEAAEKYAVALGERKAAVFAKMGSTELDAAQVNVNRAKAELDRLRNNYRYAVQDLTGISPQKNIKEPLQTFPNVRTREDKAADKERGQALAVAIAKHEARLKDLEAAFAGVTRAQVIGPEETALNKSQGQATAVRIAKRRDRDRALVTPDLLDEAYADNTAFDFKKARAGRKAGLVSAMRKRIAAQVESVEQQIETAAVEETSKPAAKPFVLKDNKALFREIIGREKALQGANLAVGVDAEFNEKIEQRITEFSAVFKNAKGQFQKLVDFIQMPLDTAGLASDKTPFGAKSADDLRDRATVLGYNAVDIGDTGDVIQNQQVAAQNAKDISDLFAVLAEFKVPITGSNLSGAEAPKIKKFIEYGSSLAEALTGVAIPQPNVLKNTFDSATEYKRLDRNSDLASRLPSTPTGLAETKLQTILSMMAVEFKDLFDQYSSVVKMVQDEAGVDRPQFLSAAGGKMGAHYAQADAIASLIVRELFIKAAPAKDATRALGTAKPGSDGGGKPPAEPPMAAAAADDPMGERKASALARAFHSQYEYTKMLAGLTDNEKDVINRRLKMLAENDKQVALSAQLLEKEKAIAEKRASLRGMSAGSEFETTRQEIRALDGEINNLIETGRKNEAAIKQQVIEEGRHKDMKEELRDNDRKGLDLEIQKSQAGKQFSAEIKAQVKDQIDAQKALQKANREQINQWVTGRYALYDVGNFYQNLAQQMFRLSRQIFNTTQTYRSFETAFTSVERAMQISGSAAVGMRDQFIKLSETLPVTFEDLSKIATLGAQMGIGAGGIKDFTATVAKFSAITTISADTVAQKFGRIAELAKIDSSQFQNLGSAVAFAGVNAVATESEILTLSESIAAVSTQAGLTPPEIVGMSTALASVGIQAEQARGVFTRVFADINRAVSRGGSELDAFAKVSGMSSEDFAKQWGTEGQSYNVFRKLLGGLGSSSDATKAFDALNIVETREVNTLTRLAESLGVVDQAVSDSNQSFADGTFLAASFEKTANNLDAKLVIFKNNIDSLVVSISQGLSPFLGIVLENLSGFIEILKLASKSNLAQWILPMSLSITALGAAAFAGVAGFSKLIAQIYAFRVASINSMNSSATDIAGPINKIKQLTGAYSGLIEVRSGLGGVGGPEVKGLVTPVTFKARDIVGGQREAFAEFAKTRSFASAMNIMNSTRENALLQSANILMISTNKTQGVSIGLARQQADAVQRIVDARRQEIAVMAEKDAVNGFSESELLSQKFFIKLTKDGAEVIDDATAAEIRRTAAAKGATAAQIQEAAAIKMVNAETQTATKATGLGFTGILNRITGLLGAVAIIGTVVTMVDMLRVSIEEANKIDLLGSGGSVQSLRDAMTEDTKIWRETGRAISTVKSEYEVYEPVVYAAHDAVKAISGANEDLKSTTGEVTTSVKDQTIAIGQNTKEWMLNAIVANEKVNGWLEKNPTLFNDAESALQDYGTSFADVMKSVLSDPENGQEIAIGKITTAIDKNKMALIARERELIKIKPDSSMADLLKDPAYFALVRRERAMQKIIALVPEMSGALKEGLNKSGFMASMKEIFDEAFGEDLPDAVDRGTQKAAKTLTQWSGEVAQIISSALEIRSQKTTALDGITKAWSDLRKKADDAKKAVKKAQDQINMLKANRSTLEYQLNIAIKYGDSKRATEIQAKLDENTTSLTDANDQLSEAQKNASTELKGNTDAAIDNRATLRSLVNSYVPYIQALENSTVKGETFAQKQDRISAKVGVLKKEFESQALALGFAQKDLATYLGDFDAMATIVQKVPNTVTVKVDGLPAALRALKEFASAANTELGKIKLDDKAKDAASLKGFEDQISVLKWQAQAVSENKALSAAGRASSLSIIGNTIRGLLGEISKIKTKTYATGGYVSGAGTGTSDSIPARLSNGEFVMSAKSVSNYGVDFMNSLNQSRVMYAPAQPSTAQSGGGSSVVYLSPDDRALLRAAIDRPVNLYADSTRLAQSVNNGNKVLAQRGSI